ncbi:hypothetical protein MLD38_036394 [Melastoma candidum]|uniref:Uncharacterized protein n=1 Tax=Melastoma candidum TaxID=119954 RepID=A0ACB9LJS9_9MYRT|nr:hypothetical protein MLD38_036394 [Melastoma candidum]
MLPGMGSLVMAQSNTPFSRRSGFRAEAKVCDYLCLWKIRLRRAERYDRLDHAVVSYMFKTAAHFLLKIASSPGSIRLKKQKNNTRSSSCKSLED